MLHRSLRIKICSLLLLVMVSITVAATPRYVFLPDGRIVKISNNLAFPDPPGADRILFYDFSAGINNWLTVGSGLTLSGTTLTANANDHDILDADVHTDTVADAVTRGSLIFGNSTPKWDELAISTTIGTTLTKVLGTDGTDSGFRTLANFALDIDSILDHGNLNSSSLDDADHNASYYTETEIGATSNPTGASLVGITAGVGSPTVTSVQAKFDNSGSAGYFTGGILSDGGAGTLDVSAGEGFIRATADDNAPLLSFKWSASAGIAIPDDTTQYVFVDDTGTINLNTDEFFESVDNIMLGVVTDEGGAISHAFNLGVRLQESIGQMGRYIRHVDGVTRNRAKGGLLFGESEDVNRFVTISAGQLEWGRTSYVISAFNTSGADTFDAYSAGGQEATGVSSWPNTHYDNAGTLTELGNKKWAVIWWYIEPDGHVVMLYGRAQHNTEGQAEDEAEPADSIPPRLAAASVIASKFIFQKDEDITAKIETAFGTPFTGSGVTAHNNLATLGWTIAGHTGTVSTIAAFDGTGAAELLTIGTDLQAWDADLDTLSTMQTGSPGALQLLTQAELEMLDGAIAGTAVASKALVVDASLDIGTIRNLSITSTFTDGTMSLVGGNITSMGNISGSDVDISAGTGDYLSTGDITLDSDTSILVFGDGQDWDIGYNSGTGDLDITRNTGISTDCILTNSCIRETIDHNASGNLNAFRIDVTTTATGATATAARLINIFDNPNASAAVGGMEGVLNRLDLRTNVTDVDIALVDSFRSQIFIDTDYNGTITNAVHFLADNQNFAPPGAEITNMHGFWCEAIVNAGTTNYGLRIDNISGASSNFAIKTGTGDVDFGGDLDVTGATTLDSTVTMNALPTSDPENDGELWNNLGVVTISEGS